MLKRRELADLLSRAAAAIENPGDLWDRELVDVIEDLRDAEKELRMDDEKVDGFSEP